MIEYTNLDAQYKKIVAKYLQDRCQNDPFLAEACNKENKSLDGVLNYVKSEAKKQAENNVAVIPDSDVFNWAVHYILEDGIDCERKMKTDKVHNVNEYIKQREKAQEKKAVAVADEKPKTINEEIQFELF